MVMGGVKGRWRGVKDLFLQKTLKVTKSNHIKFHYQGQQKQM